MSSLQSSLTYSGIVTFETNKIKRTIHNSGTANLFRMFSKLLCKEDFSTRALPTYFMLYDVTKEMDGTVTRTLMDNPDVKLHTNKNLLTNYLEFSSYSSVEQEDTTKTRYISNFVATIKPEMMISRDPDRVSAIQHVRLAIISSDKASILSVVEFPRKVFATLCENTSAASQVLIRWKTYIDNPAS